MIPRWFFPNVLALWFSPVLLCLVNSFVLLIQFSLPPRRKEGCLIDAKYLSMHHVMKASPPRQLPPQQCVSSEEALDKQ